jgi:AraC-like DNA-binding protein
MILRQFPGVRPVAGEVRSDYSYFGLRNVVVYARSRDIAYAEHTAPLSIKTTMKGREIYEVAGVPLAVDEESYLVLNDDQPYASHIAAEDEVESFCVFFRSGMTSEVLSSLTTPAGRLLDEPQTKSGQPVHFFQKLNRRDQVISPLLKQLHAGIAESLSSSLWLDEQFHALMEGLLRAHQASCLEAGSLPAVRFSTRIELYRRLNRAKDYIDSCYAEPLNLSTVAKTACLSEHHFLRLFRQVFRTTPHRYLTEKRLQTARSLLEKSDHSIMEICLSVGFENHSSFTRLFRRRFGHSPQQLRLKSA